MNSLLHFEGTEEEKRWAEGKDTQKEAEGMGKEKPVRSQSYTAR